MLRNQAVAADDQASRGAKGLAMRLYGRDRPRRRLCLTSLLIGGVLCVGSTVLGQSQWKAGMAEVKITPESPVFLSGYASRNRPSEGVLADLYAKVLALEDRDGRQAVLITADLIGFRAEFAEPMCERIQARTGLKREQILLNASHTHTGPWPTLSAQPRGNITADGAARLVNYTRKLQSQIEEAVERALSRLEPAQLAWGTGVENFVMNRRQHTDKGVILGVNPRGPVDRSVPVLRVSSPGGTLRAVLFGAACHNTTLTGRHYRISGDYAGFAQQYIQARLQSVQAMFMLGCGADANPYPRGEVEYAIEHGHKLGKEVLRVLETELRPVSGRLGLGFSRLDLPLQKARPRRELNGLLGGSGWERWVGGRMLETLQEGNRLPTHYRVPVAVWQMGSELTLVGLPGETVVDYVALLEQALGPLRLWIAGYCNDVFGYLPSARLLREGGYETRGLIYGGLGFFAPEAQDLLVREVQRLARRAGRAIPDPK